MQKKKNKTIYIYDIEITPYSFIYGDFDVGNEEYNTFVISSYRDDREKLKEHLFNIIECKSWQCGFNNLDYDYPLLHHLINMMKTKRLWDDMTDEEILYRLNEKNKQLIPDNKDKKSNKFGKNYNVIHKPYINQIDLYKIHHFDNSARRTSLKKLEINMRFPNVQDFNWEKVNVYDEEVEKQLIKYNINDVNATKELYYLTRGQLDKVTVNFPGRDKYYSTDRIDFRVKIGKKYGLNLINASDVKIGEEINKKTYLKLSGRSWYEIKDRRTYRQYIYGKDLIPPYIREYYKDKELVTLLKLVEDLIIDVNKPSFEHTFIYMGNVVNFKMGGIHSDDKPKIVEPDLKIYNFEEHDVGSLAQLKLL